MKFDFENPAHLKIHLLSQGIRINPNFFKYFTEQYLSNSYFYQKDNSFQSSFPNHMLLSQETCCGLNLDEKSPWELTASKTEFLIKKNDKNISRVTFPQKPKFYDQLIAPNILGKQIGALNGTSALSFFINNTCFLWDSGVPCAFCGYKPTRNIVKNDYLLTPKLALALTKIALKELPEDIKCLYFCGGTYPDFDLGFTELFNYVSSLHKLTHSQLPIEIMNFPPKTLSLIKELKQLGADGINFCIEVANPDLFTKICPGKHKFYGYENFISAARTASRYFPKRAFLNIVLGLDDKEDLIAFIKDMIKQDIMVSMNVFYPAPYSALHQHTRPSVDYIYDVVLEQQKIYKKYHRTPVVPGSYRHGLDFEAFRQML